MKRCLMIGYGGGHIQMLLPVARYLRDNRLATPIIMGLSSARQAVERAGFDCLGFSDFVMLGDSDALNKGFELTRDLPVQTVSAAESAAYLGLSWRDLVTAHGPEQADQLYSQYQRQAFLPVPTMKRVLAQLNPDVLVTTSAPRAERAAVLAARELGIAALCLVDLFAAYEIEWLRAPDYGDRICVLNSLVKQRLVCAGRAESQVVVTGNPAFDSLFDPLSRIGGQSLRQSWPFADRKIWLWASQVEPQSHPLNSGRGDASLPSRILQQLRQAISEQDNMALVIRPHPSDKAQHYELGLNEYLATPADPIQSLIHACDGAVVMTSTVGLEAHLAGKYVIQILGSLYSADSPFAAYGIAQEVVELKDIDAALGRAARAGFTTSQTYSSAKGAAVEAVVEQLLVLLK